MNRRRFLGTCIKALAVATAIPLVKIMVLKPATVMGPDMSKKVLSFKNQNVVLVGLSNGEVWRTTDGGKIWREVKSYPPTTGVELDNESLFG